MKNVNYMNDIQIYIINVYSLIKIYVIIIFYKNKSLFVENKKNQQNKKYHDYNKNSKSDVKIVI